MKTAVILTVIVVAIAILRVDAFAQAVRETPATIGLLKGGNPQGVIQGSNAQGIIFSTVSGQPGKLIPYSQIRGEGLEKLIRIDARAEALSNARAFFAEGKYREAAAEFGKVSNAFGILLAIPQNFAVEARFFQLESLRRAGAFAEMAPLLETPAGKAIPVLLGKNYQRFYNFHKLWALYGEKKMDALKAKLESYQVPVTGQAKLLREPNFKDLPTSELAQIAFLRAKVYAAAGDKQRALDDYYRVMSLTYGNDSFLAKQSMGAAMVIQKADPKLADANDKTTLRQMQSLAFLYSREFGSEGMPPAFKKYAVRPKMPKSAAPKTEEKNPKTEEPKGDAKKEAPKGAKPAEAKKPTEKKKK